MTSKIFGKKKKPKKPCRTPVPDTVNASGGRAYSLTAEEILAKFAVTGCFGGTFYNSAEEALSELLGVLTEVSPEFIEKAALYSKKIGLMKDMPIFLILWGIRNHHQYDFRDSFKEIVNNTTSILRVTKIVTSNALGFKNFGSRLRRMLTTQLLSQPDYKLMFETGNAPSVKDVINLLHPKPTTPATTEAFKYLAGDKSKMNKANLSDIAGLVLDLNQGNINFSDLSIDSKAELAKKIDIRLFQNWKLDKKDWEVVAQNVNFMTALFNLNTFYRNDALNSKTALTKAVKNLSEGAQKAKIWPYRLFTAAKNLAPGNPLAEYMPDILSTILKKNREKLNLPQDITLCVDISRSMRNPITGVGHAKDSTVSSCDVAGIFAAMINSYCENTKIVVFNTVAKTVNISGDAFAIANEIGNMANGGTCCEASIMHLINKTNARSELVIMISDNESWAQFYNHSKSASFNWYGNTISNPIKGLREAWNSYKKLVPKAKLVLLDLTPTTTTQLLDGDSVLNLAGFNDNVLTLISEFANGNLTDFSSIIKNL